MLNDREIATLFWIALLALTFTLVPSLRRSMGPSAKALIRGFAHPKVAGIFALFVLWCALWAWFASLVKMWDWLLTKDTLLIIVGVGFPLLFRSMNAKTGADIAHQVRREALSLSVLFAFYLNFTPLPLWAELVLLPILALFAMMIGFGTYDARGRPFVGCSAVVLGLVTASLIVWTTVQTVTNWESLDGRSLMLQLALSVWLPLAMFPFLYVIAFYAATESLLTRFSVLREGMPLRARLGVLVGLRFSVRWAKALNGRYNSVSESTTFREALHAMRSFREDVERREAREEQRLADLKGFAGETGTDGSGAQLDRREFDGTKRALRWIHVTQAGQFERLGNKFWDDLTDIMLRPVSKYELPEDHGIVVETTRNKDRWRAWRRMPSGSVLGIGSAGRFGEYLYAGAVAPTSWPNDGPEWVDSARADWPPDWERDDGSRL